MDYYSDTARRISRAYSLLSKSHKRMADFILDSPGEVATMSIDELSKACGVSVATANRFAKAIGFEGFAEFRAHQVDALRETFVPVEKLKTDKYDSAAAYDIVVDGVSNDMENLENLRGSLTGDTCDRAVSMILEAERIFVHGSGISYYVAGILTYELEPFCDGNVSMMAPIGDVTRAHRRIIRAGARDLAILVAFPRYSPGTLEILEMAKERGTGIICITDSPTSPLAADADVVFYAPAQRRLLPNSATAAFSLVDALVAAVANQRQEGLDVQRHLLTRHLQDRKKKI